jgi:hypothetical protein
MTFIDHAPVREGKRSFSDVSPIPETTVLDEASVN